MLRLALVWLLCFTCLALNAEARPHHGGIAAPVNVPVLQNAADNFGNLTTSARGAVRLSSQDKTQYTAAFVPKGLDILTAGSLPCARWTTAQTGGTAGHWNVISHIAEGSSAITPTPTAAGVTAHLNGGPYTFLVSCEDASNNVLATATLTRTIKTNKYNIGSTDAKNAGLPSGFGSVPGAEILLSTGFDSTAITADAFNGYNFANQVNMTWADPAKPGALPYFNISNSSNFKLSGVQLTGNYSANPGPFVMIFCRLSTHDIVFDDVHGYSSYSLNGTTGPGLMTMNGCANATVNNVSCEYCTAGIQDGSSGASGGDNLTVTNVFINGFSNNCIFVGNGANWHFDFVTCARPWTNNANHIDSFQIADGATPPGLVNTHFMSIVGDGHTNTQGPYFGGTVLNGLGYVDDGTVGHGPGKIYTQVSGNGTPLIGSQVVSPGNIVLADNALVTARTATTMTLSLTSNVNIGSPGSPVAFYGAGLINATFNGIIYSGGEFNGAIDAGENGTNVYQNFSFASQRPAVMQETAFTATLTGSDLNVTTPGVSTVPGVTPYIGTGPRIAYGGGSPCNYCGPGIGSQTSGSTPAGPGHYAVGGSVGNVGPIAMTASEAYFVGDPAWQQVDCNVAGLHGGSLSIASGWAQGGIITDVCGTTFAANTTKTNLFNPTSAPGASAYVNGDPQTFLEAQTWDGVRADEEALECKAFKPKAGGPLDLGSGNWAGAIRPIGAAWGWNSDSTVIPGC